MSGFGVLMPDFDFFWNIHDLVRQRLEVFLRASDPFQRFRPGGRSVHADIIPELGYPTRLDLVIFSKNMPKG